MDPTLIGGIDGRESEIKLPKQWKHWARDMRLSAHQPKGRNYHHRWFYLQGRGRYWRVNCYGQFQCGDTYADFDRWALCDIEELPMPTTRHEFRMAVGALLAEKARKEGTRNE